MDIIISTPTKVKYTYNVPDDMTIDSLKAKLEKDHKFPAQKVMLHLFKQNSENIFLVSGTLEECGVSDGDEIWLTYQKVVQQVPPSVTSFMSLVSYQPFSENDKVANMVSMYATNMIHCRLPQIMKNNEELIAEAKEQYITVYKAESTDAGMKRVKQLFEKVKGVQTNPIMVRLITDRTRKEKDHNGKEFLNNKAGDDFKRQVFEAGFPITFVKTFHSGISIEECRSYALFWPEYLTLEDSYFNGLKCIPYQNSKLVSYIQLKEKGDPFQENWILSCSFMNELKLLIEDKLKNQKSSDYGKNYEVTKILQLYNPKLLKAHKDLYNQFWRDIKQDNEGNSQKTRLLPKHVLVFHGTALENMCPIFENGLNIKGVLDKGWYGEGFYVTTYPQYATFYCKQKGPVKEIIAGFALPGKSDRVMNVQTGQKVKDGCDSAFIRVKGYHPSMGKDDETADEIVLTKTEQFYPCFQITLTEK